MSTSTASNPLSRAESKGSRKKKNKTDGLSGPPAAEQSITLSSVQAAQPTTETGANGADAGHESPYIKELHKNIRNVKKKLTATQKVDSIIAENPGKSLDDLLADRKINADQKLQAERKPALQASLVQLDEQLEHYKKFEEELKQKHAADLANLGSEHEKELSRAKDAAAAAANGETGKKLKDKLLALSRFLRTAAAKRQDGDETADENRAFEGALLLVYGGDTTAVQAMEKIIEGSEDHVPTVEGVLSGYTYKHVRDASVGDEPLYAAEEAWVESVAQSESAPVNESSATIGSDPTAVHAGLTEIDAPLEAQVNGGGTHLETPSVPEASNTNSGAANAAAEKGWNADMTNSLTSGPDGWVEVQQIPRDPTETDTGLTATPAGNNATQSWAEDVPTEAAVTPAAPAPANDGFHEVHHNRGRGRGSFHGEHRGGRGRGGFRGDRGGEGGYRGGEGGYRGRGRGFRGDRGGEGGYRGRGRGGPRGPRGGRGDASE